ncbi:hypothetical protein QTMMAXBI_0001 [Klebsiella phage Toyotomi]|nr:hypothetical protein QTMMAXBI_0001 [Klebsiella phage Toyotomi]
MGDTICCGEVTLGYYMLLSLCPYLLALFKYPLSHT